MRLLFESACFVFGIVAVVGQDDFGNENGGAEYQNIFKNIPTLFEYMLQTLEDKPEVLENNNANVFKADDDESDKSLRFQRSANEKELENRKFEEKKDSKEEAGDDDTIRKISDENQRETYSGRNNLSKNNGIDDGNKKEHNQMNSENNRIAKRNTHEVDKIDNSGVEKKSDKRVQKVKSDKRETARKKLEESHNITVKNIRDAVKSSMNKKRNVDKEEVDKQDSYDGNEDTTWRLTSDEVAQQALRVEEMLEKHNSSRR